MSTYVMLIRGINVGGKNRVPMAGLRGCLEELGFANVSRVLILTPHQLQAVIDNKPEGFGEQPEKYHNDAIFLLGIDAAQAMPVFAPREGVDKVWPGDSVIYSQRLSAQRTNSRLSRIVGTPVYQSMTIRNWNTTTKLLEIVEERDAKRRE